MQYKLCHVTVASGKKHVGSCEKKLVLYIVSVVD